MTRVTALRPTLTPEDRAALTRWLREARRPYAEGRRARLVMLVAAGHTVGAAAALVGLSRPKATHWLQRFAARGLPGLTNQQRGPPRGQGGRPPGRPDDNQKSHEMRAVVLRSKV